MEEVAGFDWDKGNRGKCQKHGVSLAEIEQGFRHDPLIFPDRTGSAETRFNAVGVTMGKRHMFIVFTLRENDEGQLIRPISARYMHDDEVKAYDRTKRPQALPDLQDRRGSGKIR
jgi:uncharacterized DUF497 family protein